MCDKQRYWVVIIFIAAMKGHFMYLSLCLTRVAIIGGIVPVAEMTVVKYGSQLEIPVLYGYLEIRRRGNGVSARGHLDIHRKSETCPYRVGCAVLVS